MKEPVNPKMAQGFSLIELMIAIAVLTFGLLAVGQLFYVTASSSSLSGSKSSAAIAAQNMLDALADLYNRNPAAEDLSFGGHMPRQIQVTNPIDGTILNQYSVAWVVNHVPDPRPGKIIDAKLVSVTVSPVQAAGAENNRPPFNKKLSVATVFSTRMQ
jgi:prepilin-type N-terminal cleavage/methylation domain-containing protein